MNATTKDAGKKTAIKYEKKTTSKEELGKKTTSKEELGKKTTSKEELGKKATSNDELGKKTSNKNGSGNSKDASGKKTASKVALENNKALLAKIDLTKKAPCRGGGLMKPKTTPIQASKILEKCLSRMNLDSSRKKYYVENDRPRMTQMKLMASDQD